MPLLSYEQRSILAGWFCVRFDNGQDTDLAMYQRAAKHLFGVSLSERTAHRYIAEFDLTWQLMGARSHHKVGTKEALILDALEWLQRYHADGFPAMEPQKLWCTDGVTDSLRVERIHRYGKKNGGQRKCRTPKKVFTSTFLPMVNAVGQQLVSAIDTYDPDLDPNGRNGYNVWALCRRLGLQPKNIYFLRTNDVYCPESRSGYSSFLMDTQPWRSHRLLYDDSPLFRGKGKDFFEDLGFEAHRLFVPSAHGPLSLIDGFINAWAKGGWHQSRKRFAFQWERTLLLAHEMLHIPARETAMAWERHMLVGSTPTREQVEQFLFPHQGNNEARENLWDKCVLAYAGLNLDAQWEDTMWYPDVIDSSLDGAYWL